MLLYSRRATPKPPKRRSRAGCLSCKEKKKKCNEQQPQCDRCTERGIKCEYEPVKPRKRKSTVSNLAPPAANPAPKTLNSQHVLHTENDGQSFNGQNQWAFIPPYEYSTPGRFTDVAVFDPQDEYYLNDDVEEIVRSNSMDSSMTIHSRGYYPDLAMIAPSPIASPLLEFNAPLFEEFTNRRNRRALVDHFCNVLSHLVVFKEDTGNPFRQLVLPLSHTSSPVMDAIFALSSAHLEYRGIDNEERSVDFHNRALRGLATLIDQGDLANREEVLGAIMLLIYYEVLVQRKESNIVQSHLKGAMTIMKSKTLTLSPTTQFLERAFRFYDTIAALSFGIAPVSSTTTPLAPLNSPYLPSASPLNSVDTLLGMATDLWPIIHRLSHLLDAKSDLQAAEAAGNPSKATVLRTELESTSHAIELALTNWTPSFPNSHGSPPNDGAESDPLATEDARLQSILNNAEAYRQAAFVYLYKDVKGLPRRSKTVQTHAKATINACEMVVEWAGPMSALLWPAFVGACEAVEEGDREMARRAFEGIERRQGMTNIAKAWEIVEEVWRRDDQGVEEGWRTICVERGISIVFG